MEDIKTLKSNILPLKYIARIRIEAVTPLAISSGRKDVVTDSYVVRDINNLPFLPGTSITGILRHSLDKEKFNEVFGYRNSSSKSPKSYGSQLIVSEAKLVGSDNRAIEGIYNVEANEFLKNYMVLPIRQHVKINDKGTTDKGGKFDEQIVYKGSRFCFELELNTKKDSDKELFSEILKELYSKGLRIGSGSRKGLGAFKVVSIERADLDLRLEDDLQAYINKPVSLAQSWDAFNTQKEYSQILNDGLISYQLKLKPDDFFLFSAASGNDEVDICAVEEGCIKWNNDRGEFVQATENILIPASSVKGAIAHRTAFHYNKIKGYFVEQGLERFDEANLAVVSLFGTEDKLDKKRGAVLFSDVLDRAENKTNKILNHITIDRFTQGGIDGALFSEEITHTNQEFILEILLNEEDVKRNLSTSNKSEYDNIIEAFKRSLDDLCRGMLPLGGGVNRGNGIFSGEYSTNSKNM